MHLENVWLVAILGTSAVAMAGCADSSTNAEVDEVRASDAQTRAILEAARRIVPGVERAEGVVECQYYEYHTAGAVGHAGEGFGCFVSVLDEHGEPIRDPILHRPKRAQIAPVTVERALEEMLRERFPASPPFAHDNPWGVRAELTLSTDGQSASASLRRPLARDYRILCNSAVLREFDADGNVTSDHTDKPFLNSAIIEVAEDLSRSELRSIDVRTQLGGAHVDVGLAAESTFDEGSFALTERHAVLSIVFLEVAATWAAPPAQVALEQSYERTDAYSGTVELGDDFAFDVSCHHEKNY